MALVFHPAAVYSISISPKLSFHKPRCFRFSASAPFSIMRVESNSAQNKAGAAIVWYKHDLRVEDHLGLVAAASHHRSVLPLYVFDRRILSRFSDEVLELLLYALEDLRKLLREQGSDLMIRFGSAERVICELVKEVQATSVFVEEEVEHELCVMLDIVKASLKTATFSGVDTKIMMWSTPFYDIKSFKDLPDSFDDFKKLKLPVVSPIVPPKLPGQPVTLSWGALPTLADLKTFVEDSSDAITAREWTSIKKNSAERVLQQGKLRGGFPIRPEELKENIPQKPGSQTMERKKLKQSAFVTSQGSLVGGGASLVLNALAAYLRYLEGTARDDWQEYISWIWNLNF